jgi:hypothetical protein
MMKYKIEARYDWGQSPLPGLLPILVQEVDDWEKVLAILVELRKFPAGLTIEIDFIGGGD